MPLWITIFLVLIGDDPVRILKALAMPLWITIFLVLIGDDPVRILKAPRLHTDQLPATTGFNR